MPVSTLTTTCAIAGGGPAGMIRWAWARGLSTSRWGRGAIEGQRLACASLTAPIAVSWSPAAPGAASVLRAG